MDPFLELFFSIDADQSEIISSEELRKYVEENHLDDGMIERWKTLFDPENTGNITLDKFCDVLGVKPEQAQILRIEKQAAKNEKLLGSDVEVIFVSMSIEDQIEISSQVRRLIQKPSELTDKEIVNKLKIWLDEKFHKIWHVGLIDGSHTLAYNHIENYAFQFCMKNRSFFLWRTPEY